jgi:sorbitol/mannitol transport system substrate-binding protein
MAMEIAAYAETITIAAVNECNMIRMQKLSGDFTAANPGIEQERDAREENVPRQRVTADVAAKGG